MGKWLHSECVDKFLIGDFRWVCVGGGKSGGNAHLIDNARD